MAAESNTGFRHGGTFGSPFSRHAISFQSGAINSTSDMIPMANYYGINSTAGMVFSGNSSIINNNPGMTQAGSSSGSFLLDSVPGLKHDADMAAEWSVEEQQRLEEGLDKYAAEPSIMKYIKIAAMLNDKDVRAVALRCRWMTVSSSLMMMQSDHHLQGRTIMCGKLKNPASNIVGHSSFPSSLSPSPFSAEPPPSP
ncbi:hypothetical protein CsSME_00042661 [Camellia sinensis var. sinensis]